MLFSSRSSVLVLFDGDILILFLFVRFVSLSFHIFCFTYFCVEHTSETSVRSSSQCWHVRLPPDLLVFRNPPFRTSVSCPLSIGALSQITRYKQTCFKDNDVIYWTSQRERDPFFFKEEAKHKWLIGYLSISLVSAYSRIWKAVAKKLEKNPEKQKAPSKYTLGPDQLSESRIFFFLWRQHQPQVWFG